MKTLAILVVLMCVPAVAFAGTCPSSASYVDTADSTGPTVTLASLGVTHCYYISTTGLDTATGADESHPWRHAPGMQGCSRNCSALTPAAGDGFIFEGGDTWDDTNFAMNVTWSGSSGSPIYFGVDPAWYSGGSWARPIFSGGGTTLPNGDGLIVVRNQSYVILDDFELTDLMAYSNWGPGSIELSCDTYVFMTRLYVHNWALDASVSTDDAHGGIFGNSPYCSNVGTVIDHSVLSNVEHTGNRQNGTAVRAVDVQYSTIHDVSTAQLFGRIHDSTIDNVSYPSGNESFDPGYHTNVTYLGWGDASVHTGSDRPQWAYNNVIHDFNAGSGGLYLVTCGTAADATYVYNNVIYNNYTAGDPDIQLDPDGASTGCGDFYIWNNTLQDNGPLSFRVVNRGFKIGTVVLENNHYITDGSMDLSLINNLRSSNNVTQTNAAATAAGYTSSQTYPFSPTSDGSATVGVGLNLTSSCTGLFSTLCSDTTDGCNYDSTSHATICPARTPLARSTPWDVGAYQFSASQPQGPVAPTNLQVMVH